MSKVQTTAESSSFKPEEVKLWKCGHPQDSEHKYPIPEPSGDPWEDLLTPLLKKDKAQCDAWKDEVQNLLIFAGLFSAVVTAFVVDSYKALKPDPNDTIIYLLSRIDSRQGDTLNTTAIALPAFQSFNPTQSAIRINIYWLLSLVLSLTTVLFGIVSLQWLREHQHYHGIRSKQAYAIFHMRAEALHKWYVPQLLASLPLILQGALVLFFVGVIDFLLSLNRMVAAPIIFVIGITFLFLVGTTLLPTLQAFPLYIPYLKLQKSGAPAQCPYKSPQSQAFRSMSGVMLWSWSKIVVGALYYPIIWIRHIVIMLSAKIRSEGQRELNHEWILNPDDILVVWKKRTWIEFDLAWLDVRDNYLTTGRGIRAAPTFPLHVPLYDLVQGLGRAIKEHGAMDSEAFVATMYRCFQEMSQNTHDIHHWQYPYQLHLQALLKRFLKRGVFGYISDVVDSENFNLLYDENCLAFLTIMLSNRNLEDIVPKLTHFHELSLRIMAFFAACPQKLKDEPSGQNFPFIIKFDYPGLDASWDKATLEEFSKQWVAISYSFFKAITEPAVPEGILTQSLHAHDLVNDFIPGALVRLKHVHEANINPALVSDCLLAVINLLTTTFEGHLRDDKVTRRVDLLLRIASAFSNQLQYHSWLPDSVFRATTGLTPVLTRYRRLSDEAKKASAPRA